MYGKSNMETYIAICKIDSQWEFAVWLCMYLGGWDGVVDANKPVSAAAAAKSLQSCPTLCDPIDGSHQAPPSLGFSRQEHWSGLPFPSPVRESESEVAQVCPTLSDPMDCSLPGSSVLGIFQAKYWNGVPLPSPKPVSADV